MGRKSSKKALQSGAAVRLAFKLPPRLLEELIALVNCLPSSDSLEFKLLHPSVINAEVIWDFDAELGVKASKVFAGRLNATFDASTRMLRGAPREVFQFGHVLGCAQWGVDGEALSDEFARHFGPVVFGQLQSDFVSEFGERTAEALTLVRAERFRVPERLLSFLKGTKPYSAWKWMTDLYEALYRFHDTAYLCESGRLLSMVSIPQYASTSSLLIEDGIVREWRSLFWNAIHSVDVEATRIRVCKVCGSIFWAGRLNQKCCGARCGNTFRVHRYRYKTNDEKANYSLRRIQRERKREARKRRG